MIRSIRSCLSLGGLLLLAIAAPAAVNYLPERDKPVPADQQIPAVDFSRPLLFSNPVLNPAGTHFAARSMNAELRDNVLICEIATGKITWTNAGIWDFQWISNKHLILNHGGFVYYGFSRDGILSAASYLIIDITKPERKVPYKDVLPDLKRGLMPDTGFLWSWPEQDKPDGSLQDYWASPVDGLPGFCVYIKEDGRKLLYRYENKKWVECPVDLDEITPITPGHAPGEMIVLGPKTKGQTRAIQRLDTATGTLGEVVYRDPARDCGPLVYFKRGTREISGVYVPNSARRIVWLDEKHREVQAMINRQFAGSIAEIVSTDIKESLFLIGVESDRQPPIYYMLNYEKKSLGLIKNTGPWIDPARMRPMQVMSFKARDGSVIEGFLVLPEGASKENPAPLIVDIHGGPGSPRHFRGWDSHVQFLASRGYAVFQPNYRGSYGYDSRFEELDRFDFQKMAQDVSDGTRALCKSGLIDPTRVGLSGVGFGAYLALLAKSSRNRILPLRHPLWRCI